MSCVSVPVNARLRSARVLASCVVLSVTAGCAVDVTEYTPFATSTKETATASAASPAHTGSTAAAGREPVYASTSNESGSGSVTVRHGDTLYGLSRRHGVSLNRLIASNNLARPYMIRPGQTLIIPSGNPSPAGATYRPSVARSSGSVRVAPGDTVYGIARRHNVNAGRLIAANRLAAPYAIHPGQSLRLPSGSSLAGQRPVAPVYTASAGASRGTYGATSVRVARGDTLYGIARRHRVPVRQLIAINRIPAPFHIHTGQVLSLSWRSASAAPQVKPVAASPKSGFESNKAASSAAGANLSADRTTGVPALEPVDGERQPLSIRNRYRVPAKTAKAYNRVVNKHGVIPGQTVLVPF